MNRKKHQSRFARWVNLWQNIKKERFYNPRQRCFYTQEWSLDSMNANFNGQFHRDTWNKWYTRSRKAFFARNSFFEKTKPKRKFGKTLKTRWKYVWRYSWSSKVWRLNGW